LLAPAVRTMRERKTPAADIEPFVEALSRAQRDSTLGSRNASTPQSSNTQM
jgi:hypothetical protein